MKKLQYIILALAMFVTGCEDPLEADKKLINDFDHTLPAYIMMSHGMRVVAAASSTLISACNLNEWLTAEDAEARMAVEDKYYPYYKVREAEENLWMIYSHSYSESYLLDNGLTLDEEGARWSVCELPNTVYQPKAEVGTQPIITRLSEDVFEVVFRNTHIWFDSNPKNGLYRYLFGGYLYHHASVDAILRIESNNSEFRKGETEDLFFTISGSGAVGGEQRYSLLFEIEEPIVFHLVADSQMVEGTVGVGVMSLVNCENAERTTATFTPYNAIIIDYYSNSAGKLIGYYDWSGCNISPR